MSEPPSEGPERPGLDEEPEAPSDREAILRRRRRFIAVALSGLTTAGGLACDGDEPEPVQVGEVEPTAGPSVCLEIPAWHLPDEDAGPSPGDGGAPDGGEPGGADAGAASAAGDAGVDAGVDAAVDAGFADYKPPRGVRRRRGRRRVAPCLQPPPMVCLMFDFKAGDDEPKD